MVRKGDRVKMGDDYGIVVKVYGHGRIVCVRFWRIGIRPVFADQLEVL